MSAPSTNNSPMTAQQVALRLLRYIGVRTLDGTAIPEKLQPGDLEDVCSCINGAMQELWDAARAEIKTLPDGAKLRPPTTVTLSATEFSKTVASITPWADWMLGCTIRIDGDDQDNELVSQTSIAVPFGGTTGTVSATVFNDCIQLPSDYGAVIGDVLLQNVRPLLACNNREEYMRWAGAPTITDASGNSTAFAFYSFRKVVGIPMAYYVQGAFDSNSPYTLRRMRLAPMPDGQNYEIFYNISKNPPFYSPTDIKDAQTDGEVGDPGVTFPIPNGWVESLLLPLALQRFTAMPGFLNEAAKPEIQRQFQAAKLMLSNTRPQRTVQQAHYP